MKILDKLFGEFIRRRAIQRVGGCERCLRSKSSFKLLHCAHMFPRRRRMVRWDEDNAAGLCPGCHLFLDDNALDKIRFFVLLLGQEKFDLLEARSTQVGKPDVEAIMLYLEEQLRRME